MRRWSFQTLHLASFSSAARNNISISLHALRYQDKSSKMSWMDSWSRPSKHQATPAPFYLLPDGESTPYCKSCGRVISSRKGDASKGSSKAAQPSVKYCSARCRTHKPGKLDREIEKAFTHFLTAGESATAGKKPQRAKGESRVLVLCDQVQAHVFGNGPDVEGPPSKKNRNKNDTITEGGHADDGVGKTDEQSAALDRFEHDFDEENLLWGESTPGAPDYKRTAHTRTRPPQSTSDINDSVRKDKGQAEPIPETPEMREKRIQGQKKAKEREMVRSAARRGVVFGFVMDENSGQEERVKCEAVMQGNVVEPSYAKGNWGVRWRE
ncbi:hypothetical protein QQX98_007068 [Neonectria punicea]|uniref:Chitinase n=1 Tax=Neonectria punicea TaxID=979145 RepID=A0ABR1GZ13_9HYPO